MSLLKKISLAAAAVFILIQFIQPQQNTGSQSLATDITKVIAVPQQVQTVLQMACYDCHSNNTIYPWYAHVQPVGWLLENHIKNGKEKLNFNEFSSYSFRRQRSKLQSIASQVKDSEMPLWSYTLIHKNARLSNEEKQLIINWAIATKDSISANRQDKK